MQSAASPVSLAHLLLDAAQRWPDLPCACQRVQRGSWQALTYGQWRDQALALAASLAQRGLAQRAVVGLFADHSAQWLVAHGAIQLLGAADCPRGQDVSDHELAHITRVTQMTWAIVADASLARRVKAVAPDCQTVVIADDEATNLGLSLTALISEGQADADRSALDQRLAQIRPTDRHAVIFTSATTGTPKGVVISHRAMLAQLASLAQVISLGIHDRVLSLLPVWHIFERMATLFTLQQGASLWFTSPRRFAEDLSEVQPSFMASAPRLWEALDSRIVAALRKAHPLRRALVAAGRYASHHFRAAARALCGTAPRVVVPTIGQRMWSLVINGLRWAFFLLPHGLLNTAVLERIRQSTGACLDCTVSGGGALPPAVDEFFTDLGLPICEGYGMTEFPAISMRRPGFAVPGTVGPLLPGVELRLFDLDAEVPTWSSVDGAAAHGQRGEIHVRGEMRMDGYWQDEAATAHSIVDGGWLRTGDIGVMGADGCLRIVGRCKDTIVLRSGENVEPGPIEDAIRRSPLIEQVVVVGQDAKHLGALLVPDLEGLAHHLGQRVEDLSLSAVAQDRQLTALYQKEVHRLVAREQGFRSYELVADVALLPRALELGRELTNLLKVRRHVVHEIWAELIEQLVGDQR